MAIDILIDIIFENWLFLNWRETLKEGLSIIQGFLDSSLPLLIRGGDIQN